MRPLELDTEPKGCSQKRSGRKLEESECNRIVAEYLEGDEDAATIAVRHSVRRAVVEQLVGRHYFRQRRSA